LSEIIKSTPQWHIREVDRALVDEDLGDGSFPKFKDIDKVGDILRIGAAGLAIRFREVDPEIWKWLIESLEEIR
jgi:hypothetical protein